MFMFTFMCSRLLEFRLMFMFMFLFKLNDLETDMGMDKDMNTDMVTVKDMDIDGSMSKSNSFFYSSIHIFVRYLFLIRYYGNIEQWTSVLTSANQCQLL